jgi:NAD(P)-dependent dehydrogenase (short-subunit alcohol dehydrogenase family)
MSLLSGKIALITGASRGIGAAIARLCAQQGAKVAVHGRDTPALLAVRADIERGSGTAIHVLADVTKFGEMRRRVEQEFGPIDILVVGDLLDPGFGQPTSRVTQVFGSGGPRAFQIAARVSF